MFTNVTMIRTSTKRNEGEINGLNNIQANA
jgi:hypothetical protein